MTKKRHEENIDVKDRKISAYNNCKRWRKFNQVALLYSRAKSRAKKSRLEFTIEKCDIVIPEVCPLLGVKFSNTYVNPNDDPDFAPSLDRFDNTIGYTKENTWVICWKANRMKNTATLNELKKFSQNILNIIQYD